MAKMRIYALANELNMESKEVIKFLAEKDITGKTASSSVEDDVIDMVKKKFSGQAAGSKKEQPQNTAAQAALEKPQVQQTPQKAVSQETPQKAVSQGAPEKAVSQETPEKAAPRAAEKTSSQEPSKPQERPKKKSSITAVFNPQNSKTAKKRPMRPRASSVRQGRRETVAEGRRANSVR